MDHSLGEIDELIAAFYAAFDNRGGRAPTTSSLSSMFTPHATIARLGPNGVDEWNLESFLAPRQKLLTDGSLRDFHEWEIEAKTTVSRELASRHSRYQKKGTLEGAAYAGEGTKFIQLCKVARTWKISSILWQDI
ncbi:hypothetical protein SAMN05216466_106378 [Paraburkholderia phenazinium]|uniref:DUF4440 domain-containing protein n=1 Tax=Paraburkholderia phenazinium TaxID=60549 RepID=A0A1G7YZJ0_9BURK|nr:DUF4440 domain-containing protein [Paraburkholderia phenazinium]SDH01755.1 hypothetical protein SAMN05216466_106378 [Paraburkholderia phenazinium]